MKAIELFDKADALKTEEQFSDIEKNEPSFVKDSLMDINQQQFQMGDSNLLDDKDLEAFQNEFVFSPIPKKNLE